MWPASNQHPLHNDYPVPGGCIGSKFDACSEIPPGGSWQFQFTAFGAWKYHDHRKSSVEGTVIVE